MQLQILYSMNTSAVTSSPHVPFGSDTVKDLVQGLCVLMWWMSISPSEADMCTVLWVIAHEFLQNLVGPHSKQIIPFIWQTLKNRGRNREKEIEAIRLFPNKNIQNGNEKCYCCVTQPLELLTIKGQKHYSHIGNVYK